MNDKLYKIFICSPYHGDIENNIKQTQGFCRFVIKQGYMPVAPHLYFPQFLNDNDNIEKCKGMELGLKLLKECDALWTFGNITENMQKEIDLAKSLNLPVVNF